MTEDQLTRKGYLQGRNCDLLCEKSNMFSQTVLLTVFIRGMNSLAARNMFALNASGQIGGIGWYLLLCSLFTICFSLANSLNANR
jgi:hypothetical protein